MKISTLLAKRVYGRIPVWTLILLLIVLIAGVRAAVLFTHNFSVPATAPALTTSCAGSTLVAMPSTVISNTGPGAVLFTCPGGGAALSASSGTVTPSFAIAGGTSLGLVSHTVPLQPCETGNVSAVLAPSSPVTFGGSGLSPGAYDYCLSYDSFPVAGVSFSVTWSQ